ncbi:cupredoxin domain-containing protein [Thauera linaloolentis]|uniref:Blue (Type 1) copper domain-containing protein n=1 Tax=Thauera linaloolentis (strain DSM 12138 / JCM 21573 / CCUG 41526 / CIP 105981 / IAM 15112 / NBRC 102519 / 47Lol) TaxID=1123367 RepID=N6YSU6_THAL4|nr:plastocyanin/azurin family copper-binding protein [Thauera linaloolentis]ENO85263.1 blue (type 1) copper domain-containing protein [Thauera linaloolentis 47Lol = DSM 12138]MCM8564970.1 plastocyanin/azurin family copper-binding protein [Thauera linaloolentis]
MQTKSIARGLRAGLLATALAGGAAVAAEHEVRIVQYAYAPAELTIKAGDTVTWINGEKRVSHSVLFSATGEESERFFPGERWSRTFDQPGRFEYRCGPHPEMKGLVVVEP